MNPLSSILIVDGCDIYQRIKSRTKASVKKLMANEVSKKPWIYLIVDFIMKLPLVAKKNAILVVYNRLSKMAYFIAITEGILAKELVQLFRDNM